MPGLLDYAELMRRNTPKTLPGFIPQRPLGVGDPLDRLGVRSRLERLQDPGFQTDITKPDNNPTYQPPTQEERARANIKTLLTGQPPTGSDPPGVTGFDPFPKAQDRIAAGPALPGPDPWAKQDVLDTFKPEQLDRPASPPPSLPKPDFAPAQVAAPLPPPRPTELGLPSGRPTVAPMPPTDRPAPTVATNGTPMPPTGRPAPTVATNNTPMPPPRPGLLDSNPMQTQAKPTGVPGQTSTSLVETPLPPERPPGLGGDGGLLAANPVAGTAPTPMSNPITPTSMLDNGMFGNGMDDWGQGLGGTDFGGGQDDWGGDFGGGDPGGGADFADAGGGDFGGGGDGGGGGGLGGLGALFGAIGKMAGGGGDGGKGEAPKLPKPPPPPKIQPMEPDPGIAKRAQGAQQVINGILADPSLIDPRKRQGLLA